jgi:hypothetical protein
MILPLVVYGVGAPNLQDLVGVDQATSHSITQ